MAGISISKNKKILFSYMLDPGIFSFDLKMSHLSHITAGMTPCWSPDGSKIVFQAFPQLVLGNSEGEYLEVIDKYGKDPSWSSDGSRIAYTYQPESDEKPVIKVFNVSTKANNIIGKGESSSWSPDGKRLAYNNHGVEIFDTVNGKVTPAGDEIEFQKDTSGGTNNFVRDLVWSPKRNQLIYVSYPSRLTIVDLDSMTSRNAQGIRPYTIGWFPDEEKVAFIGHLEGDDTLKVQAALYIFDLITNKADRIMYVMS